MKDKRPIEIRDPDPLKPLLKELKEIRAILDEHIVPKVCKGCEGTGMVYWYNGLSHMADNCMGCKGTGKIKP